MRYAATAVLFFISLNAHANLFGFDAGLYFPKPAGVTLDRNGSKSFFDPRKYYLGPRMSAPLGDSQRFDLAIWAVLPWDSNIDGGSQTQYTTLFRTALGHFLSNNIMIALGTSFRWIYIASTGKSIAQRNGSSTTTFYTPARSRSAWSTSVDVNASFYILPSFRLSVDFLVWRAVSEHRSVSYAVGGHYAFL